MKQLSLQKSISYHSPTTIFTFSKNPLHLRPPRYEKTINTLNSSAAMHLEAPMTIG